MSSFMFLPSMAFQLYVFFLTNFLVNAGSYYDSSPLIFNRMHQHSSSNDAVPEVLETSFIPALNVEVGTQVPELGVEVDSEDVKISRAINDLITKIKNASGVKDPSRLGILGDPENSPKKMLIDSYLDDVDDAIEKIKSEKLLRLKFWTKEGIIEKIREFQSNGEAFIMDEKYEKEAKRRLLEEVATPIAEPLLFE